MTLLTRLAALAAVLFVATPVALAQADGTVVAWGDNFFGQRNVPDGLRGVTAIAAGAIHSLALASDGTVVAWGDNGAGQTTIPDGLTGVTAIAAGFYHSLALTSDGTVVAWGDNFYNQTTLPDGLTGVTAIEGGLYHSLAVRSDETLVAWGRDNYDQTVVPDGLTGVTAIAGGGNHSLALAIEPPAAVAEVTLDGAEGWRMLASPENTTVGAFLGGLWTQGYTGSDNSDGACTVFTFAEAAASFDAGWICVADATDPLAPGQGVMVYVYADDDLRTGGVQGGFPKTLTSSTAVVPTGDFAFAPAFTNDGRPLAQKGWNLLGSPFGTSLDWDGVTRTGVTPTVYVYDPAFDGGGYRTYTSENGVGNGDLPGGLVPPFQGFFAKAYAQSPSLVLVQDGGTSDGGDVFGRMAPSDPPLPPATPEQSLRAATTSGDAPELATALGVIAPNPSAGRATVSWTLAEAGDVRVSVIDLLGREVAVLAEGAFAAGPQRSSVPAGLAPGVYVVRLQAGAVAQAARFTVVR